jgi:nicotinamidase-related amidase
VVLKHKVNSFRDTNLKALLDQHDVKALTIAGSMSHMCRCRHPGCSRLWL